MPKLFWNDCNGGIITTELLLIASVLVAGLLTALSTFRSSVEGEFQQLGERIEQTTRVEKPSSIKAEIGPVEQHSFHAADLPDMID